MGAEAGGMAEDTGEADPTTDPYKYKRTALRLARGLRGPRNAVNQWCCHKQVSQPLLVVLRSERRISYHQLNQLFYLVCLF